MSNSLAPAPGFGVAVSRPVSAAPTGLISRNTLIAGGVVLFHVAAIWAFNTGLLQRAVELVVPVEVLAEMIAPPAPKVEPPPPAPQPKAAPAKPAVTRTAPTPPREPLPLAIADPTPAPNAPTGALAPQPPAPPVTTSVAPPAPPSVQLPSTAADYLQNPKATYPPLSRRMGEQGLAVVRVLVGADGNPQKAELKRSSGYERLDKAALEYVMKCRYVPGKVGGVAQTMWYDAPVNYVLD